MVGPSMDDLTCLVPLDELEYLVLKLNIIGGQPIEKAMTYVFV